MKQLVVLWRRGWNFSIPSKHIKRNRTRSIISDDFEKQYDLHMHLFILCFYVYICAHYVTCVQVRGLSVGDGPKDLIQFISLGGHCLYPLSYHSHHCFKNFSRKFQYQNTVKFWIRNNKFVQAFPYPTELLEVNYTVKIILSFFFFGLMYIFTFCRVASLIWSPAFNLWFPSALHLQSHSSMRWQQWRDFA